MSVAVVSSIRVKTHDALSALVMGLVREGKNLSRNFSVGNSINRANARPMIMLPKKYIKNALRDEGAIPQ